MKLPSLLALLSVTSASAFVAPRSFPTQTAPRTALSASPSGDQHQHRSTNKIVNLSHAATAAAATIAATLASSPLAALAEEADGYEYGAVNAPGGIGLAVGLGVLAILTAAVPVILAPGEDAFNAMKEKDGDFGRNMAPPTKKFGKK